MRSVSTDEYGRVLLGAFNEFGYMEPDEQGELVYRSLVSKIPVNCRNFGEIWKIHVTADKGTIFQSYTHVFILKDDTISTIKGNFQFSYCINNRVFVHIRNSGLYELADKKLRMIKDGEVFSDQYVWTMLPGKRREILIGTSDNGFYKLSAYGIKKWNTRVDEFLVKNQIYCGTKINENYFAIGTIQDGVLIIDLEGNPVQHLNRLKGIQNNTILSIYSDNDNNLWLGLDNGIDFIMISSPLSFLYTKDKEPFY